MADLNLRAGDRVLIEVKVVRTDPDADGELYGQAGKYDVWFTPDKIHSKLYTPIEEPQTIGSVVVSEGVMFSRFTQDIPTSLPWVSEEGDFYAWDELVEPELVK